MDNKVIVGQFDHLGMVFCCPNVKCYWADRSARCIKEADKILCPLCKTEMHSPKTAKPNLKGGL